MKRRQKSDSCFPVSVSEIQTNARLVELEKELSNRQESMTTLHNQFVNMQVSERWKIIMKLRKGFQK